MENFTGQMQESVDIVLIEDNRGDIDLLTECLEETHLQKQLHAFREGKTALSFLRRELAQSRGKQPTLVLLDLNLPALDGREVLAEIKEDPQLKHIPVVVFTSSASEQDIKHCYDLHANSYIVKPSNIDQYIKTVQAICDYWFEIVAHAPTCRVI